MKNSVFILKSNGQVLEKVRNDNSLVIEYDELKRMCHFCGFEWFEVVSVKVGQLDCILILDEEGKYNNQSVNPLATHLYNNPYDYIVGDVIIAKRSGEDIIAFNEDEAKEIKQTL